MLLIEKLSRDAIVDAIWAIERLNEVGYRAIELNEAIDKGLLSEGKSALLLEDLEKAKQELTASGQNSLEKVDKAVTYLENLITVVNSGKKDDEDIFALLSLVFNKAKEIVAEFAALKLDGKISNIKAFFSEGGKVAAIMDALAQEMNILSSFVKMISAAFAQTIRIMQKIPDGFKNTDQGRKKDVTLTTYMQEASGKGTLSDFSEFDMYEIDDKELLSSLLDVMEDVKDKAGGSGIFSFKGVKNFFSNNAKSVGIGAFVGGLATLAIPVAGPLALAAVGAGIGLGVSTSKRTPKNPAKAYDTNMKSMAEKIMKTNVAKLEGLLPGFVKAVKGVKPGEFAKYAEEAAEAIQTINDGFDVDETISDFIKKYDSSFPAFKELQQADNDLFKTIIRDIVATGEFDSKVDALNGTTLQEPITQFYKEFILGESAWHLGELIIENNSMAHSFTMSELLFEEKPRPKPKKSSKPTKKTSNPTQKSAKNTKRNQKQGNQSKNAPPPPPRKKYTKAKSDIKSYGNKQLAGAKKKPSTKNVRVKAVDKKEDQLNKGFKDVNRKREITKIANDFEEKIRKIDADAATKDQKTTTPTAQPADASKPEPPKSEPNNQDKSKSEETRQESKPERSADERRSSDAPTEMVSGTEAYKLPDLAAFKEYGNALAKEDKPISDSQKKFLTILYGDKINDKLAKRLGVNKSGRGSGALGILGLGEAYDRRLLRLSGIK